MVIKGDERKRNTRSDGGYNEFTNYFALFSYRTKMQGFWKKLFQVKQTNYSCQVGKVKFYVGFFF